MTGKLEFQDHVEKLGEHTAQNAEKDLAPLADLAMLLHGNDPNQTMIVQLGTMVLFRHLYALGGRQAVQAWSDEMKAMCGARFPATPVGGPLPVANPQAAMMANPLVDSDEVAPPAPEAPAPRQQPARVLADEIPPPGPTADFTGMDIDQDEIERIKQANFSNLAKTGPDNGPLNYGVKMPVMPETDG